MGQFVMGIGFYAGVRFAEQGWVTFDNVFGAGMSIFFLGMAMGQIGAAQQSINAATTAANKFYQTQERKPDIRGPQGVSEAIVPAQPLQGRIEIKNVSFAYPETDRVVLDNVSFVVPKGWSLADDGQTRAFG